MERDKKTPIVKHWHSEEKAMPSQVAKPSEVGGVPASEFKSEGRYQSPFTDTFPTLPGQADSVWSPRPTILHSLKMVWTCLQCFPSEFCLIQDSSTKASLCSSLTNAALSGHSL